MKKFFDTKPTLKYVLMGMVIGILGIIFSYYNVLGDLERRSYDLFLSMDSQEPSNDIVIIGITEECLEERGRWPWSREVHAELFEILTEGKAAVVGMDIIFSEYAQDPAMDEALVEGTKKSIPVVYPIVTSKLAHSNIPGFFTSETPLLYSFPELKEISSSAFINVTTDADGILRRTFLWMEYEDKPIPSFAFNLWAIHAGFSEEEFEDYLNDLYEQKPSVLTVGDFEFPLDPRGQTLINYAGKPNTFLMLPYNRVLKGEYDPSFFENKIVLVGYFALGLGDYYHNPLQKDTQMFGIEGHANIINMLLKAGPIVPLPLWQNMILIMVFAVGFIVLFQLLKPVKGLILLIIAVIVYYITSSYMFNGRSLYIETVYPLMVIILGYLTSLAYTFFTEQRERQRVTRIFGRYVAQQVVDQILDLGEDSLKLGGTRKNVSLLFIDIRGFTPLSEKLTPEEVVAVLNEYFEIVTKCIFNNKGMVDKFMGDAVMAIFNAPMDIEDHSYWALKAAQDIISEGAELQRKVLEMAGVNLYFGIGINTGDAVVGNIGAQNRFEYTAIGDTVNLAARLESNAKPGQVLVSKAVYDAVEGKLPLESVGEIMVKGKSMPIQIYQLVASIEDAGEKTKEETKEKADGDEVKDSK